MDRSLSRLDTADRQQAAEPTAESDSSESVVWRDLSTKVVRRNPETASDRVTDRIQAQAGEPLTIDTGAVRATLVGVPQVRVDDLVYAHHRARLDESVRACALFDIENTGRVPLNWTSRQTKFIGTDRYTYNRAHISLDPAQLGAGCFPSQVELEPGSRGRVITPVEQLPHSVDVAKVVHTVTFRGQLDTQRLTYTL